MSTVVLFINFFLFPFDIDIDCLNCSNQNLFSVLVITETKGYVHNSIDYGIDLIKKIGDKNNFNVYHSDDSKVITSNNLKEFNSIIFLNTTGDILNDHQQRSVEDFIKSGKGYVGVHSASDTEYEWQWYGNLVGAYFRNHSNVVDAKILTSDNTHKITEHLNPEWIIEDEWYNFDYISDNINVLLKLDESSYEGGQHPDYHPITWYHKYDGGRSFYTALGHKKEVFKDQRFIKLLEKGILYASNEDF
tara:strand:- start:1391 stop:2131 length:741 start_codon:yes stop_codon:yes gene_type:complete